MRSGSLLRHRVLDWLAALAGIVLAMTMLWLVAPTAHATNIGTSPHISLAGHYNYVVTGGTLRASNNATDPCALISTNSGQSVDAGTSTAAISGIPAGATIVGAYLYFIGDGDTSDYTVTFNGNALTASSQYNDQLYFASANGGNANYKYFGGFVDVTSLVAGNGNYSFGGLSVQNVDDTNQNEPTYCTYQGVIAGWSLVVVYQDASEPLRVINIFDGLQHFYGTSITLNPSNFKIPSSPINGKMTVISWGGDEDINNAKSGLNETLQFNGNTLSDAYSPANNQYNSTINTLGSTSSWGVDVDTYDISGYLSAGQTSASTFYSTGADDDYLTAQIVSVTNTPVTDLAINLSHGSNFTYGTNGTYTIAVHNNGPSDTSGTTTVTDTLPAGLTYVSASGTGWNCTPSGQTVSCTTTSVIANGANANVITLVVAVGSGATNPTVNTATVTPDPSNFDNISVNNTDSDSTAVNLPNLSTSTKSVVDVNGGEAEPTDVLEYTITLKESAGIAATGVHVTDDMPANVGNLSITSKPAGVTDNSTTTGGANGTGKIDISGINVPANGSVTIVYTVTIDTGTSPGTQIDNTANIDNPSGPDGTPAAPTVTVLLSAAPVSGKILYVYTSNSTLTRTPQTGAGGGITIGQGNSHDWVLTPALAGALTLTGGSQVSVSMLVECTDIRGGSCRSGTRLFWTAKLFDGGTQIGSASSDTTFNHTSYALETANISIGSTTTIPVGHQLTLRITNTSSSNRDMQVEQYDGGNLSEVTLAQSTVINVDSVGTYNDANCSTPVTQNYQTGSIVYLCAVVSDPFGSTDINPTPDGSPPQVAITDAASNQQVMATMTHVSGADTTATKTFEYTYTVPATPALGTWSAKVTAWEGTEHTVNRSGSKNFTIQAPKSDLSTSTKTVVDVNGGDAEPGDVLEYTITLKESAGIAASNIHVTDDMPANVGSLTVTNNAGGTDNSTTTGGANGTGKLDISGISIPASGSKTIVYRVTIAAGTPVGTKIDNTATIDNPNGLDGVPAARTITVSQSQVPASGNKILYVYDTGSLTRTRQTSSSSGVTIGSGTSHTWALTPTLAKPLTIQAGSTISVTLLVKCGQLAGGSCADAYGYNLLWTASLFDNATSGTQIGTTSANANFANTAYALVTANIPVTAATTIAAGHQLILKIQNNSDINNQDYGTLDVAQYSGSDRSIVSMAVSTVINVDSVGIFTDATCGTASPASTVYETTGKVYLCAVVSDPFGSSDIDPSTGGTTPSITITDAGSTQQITGASMTLVSDSGAATKTYRYTYTVPTSPPATLALGGWTATVTAWEGSEYTVSDTGNGSFDVEAPNLVIVKSVSVVSNAVEGTTNPKAIPGAIMRYSIIITNQGKGPVDVNQLVVTDPIPAHTDFVVGSVTGASGTGSGLTGMTTSYSDNNGTSWIYTPSGSIDTNVTDIRFAPQGRMNGKTGATAPTFTITFNVKLQ